VWVNDKRLTLWDAARGSHIRSIDARPMDHFTGVLFSPDGSQILAAGRVAEGETVGLWDVATSQLIRIFGSHSAGFIGAMAFSPDGARVLRGGRPSVYGGDTTLKLWGMTSGTLLHTFEGHPGGVTSVAFSRDGGRIFSGGQDGTIRVWDPETGKLLATFLVQKSTGEWLTVTPEGFFDASTEAVGTDLLSIVRGLKVITIDRHYQVLHRPDLVQAKLAGDPDGKVKAAAAELETKLQPQ
jgi:WD40 repeat protein